MTRTPSLDVHLQPDQLKAALRKDAEAGLTSSPKWLPPKYFYDARGSELYEQITVLPEYYPTRTERELLRRFARDIAAAASPEILVELGSGSSEKTRLLLDAGVAHGSLHTYVPQDVSASALAAAAEQIAAEFPSLAVHGVVSDFSKSLHHLPRGGRRTIAFLGGTIGNMVPGERAEFLSGIADVLEPGEYLLMGAILVTDPSVLVAAYDDAAGVTAQFNLNVLQVLNTQLNADFPVEDFRHVALWDRENAWIEMRLEAARAMSVRIKELDLDIEFSAGEQLRTEISAKFTLDGIVKELADAGFAVERTWTDPDDRFALLAAARE
ncbi:dimethylhistidine N-methyltransferase [Rhodococcus sp. WMMA185]|uniref:L-histidine N(alpha)-methyltransferase n=1 Tax=Rhodococcus sp. WMMA185 TaxID=679318 RepID=UPI0008784051|nr:L-histidine N(alpha)-methyltransferase [Rhodococcus sp. WMMA185]AOW91865.1 dimethylhistidine N-methyltransferase [Rhodococcus sp. WMMA185]